MLYCGTVAVIEACMVQPNPKLQGVPEICILHAATSFAWNTFKSESHWVCHMLADRPPGHHEDVIMVKECENSAPHHSRSKQSLTVEACLGHRPTLMVATACSSSCSGQCTNWRGRSFPAANPMRSRAVSLVWRRELTNTSTGLMGEYACTAWA